jgi:ubiquinol-cytochrome c reductase cytochrome b subunit
MIGNSHAVSYIVPATIDYQWVYGFMITISMIAQIFSGLLIALQYNTVNLSAGMTGDLSWMSNLLLMLDLLDGNLLRYIHASMPTVIFGYMYAHIWRAVFMGSLGHNWEAGYSGILMLVLLYAVAFLGYTIVYGNMSHWAATVILNLFDWIPGFVDGFIGAYGVGSVAIQRMFVLHYALGLLILGIIVIHLLVLHDTGSSYMIETDADNHTFPITASKDIAYASLSIMTIVLVMTLGWITVAAADNSIPASAVTTPSVIMPEWYLLSVYGALRAVPAAVVGLYVAFYIIATTVSMTEGNCQLPSPTLHASSSTDNLTLEELCWQ